VTTDWWTPIASMAGVIVGGSLAFLTQRTTLRAADRADERKHAAALAEAHRSEQIQVLTQFIRAAHEAEGVAHARPGEWRLDGDWYRRARPAMDALRIAEASVELLCDIAAHESASRYARALNEAVWQGTLRATIAEALDPP
jgi:hypothetical protein